MKHGGTAVVCGNHINAHTLVRSLMGLGWTGRLVLLRHIGEPKGLAGCLNPNVEQYAADIQTPEELPSLLESRYGGDGDIYVFFTDERYHPAFAKWKLQHPNSPIRVHLGSLEHMTTILDRYEFCRFIEKRGLASVPHTIAGEADPFGILGDSFIVRPRLSWFGVLQRERVKLVRSRSEYEAALISYASRGLQSQDLSYQELLSIRNEDNVSICGWYCNDFQHIYCTRKLLQYPPSTGGGDLIERLSPPDQILHQAREILRSLEYDGPFELEFMFDTHSSSYKVTELNPRYWLQHGLIDAISGCAISRSYLGLQPVPINKDMQKLQYWVNPLYSFYRGFQLDFRSVRYWCSQQCLPALSLKEAMKYASALLLSSR
jgi:hypothetical protein